MVAPVPAHLRTVTPHLVCSPCADAIDFYVEAFGAEELGPRMTGPDGTIAHAEIRIGDSVVMLADMWPDGPVQSPTTLRGSTAAMFIYTDDVDGLWERAVAAGAEVVFPLELQFYGDRAGRLRDPFGHTWGLAQQVEEIDDQEMARRMAAFYEDDQGA